MKKMLLIMSFLSLFFVISGCSKDNNDKDGQKINELKQYEMRGYVKQVDENTFLMESRDKSYVGNVRVPIRSKDGEDPIKIDKGDIVNVVYDGKIAESDPAQITGVISVKIVEKVIKKYDDQGNELEPQKPEKQLEDFYNMPILSVTNSDGETRELDEDQSAFIYYILENSTWGKEYDETMKSDYKITEGGNFVANFDSKLGVIFDPERKVSVTLEESIAIMVQDVLDNLKTREEVTPNE